MRNAAFIGVIGLAGLLLLAAGGCETDSVPTQITITPSDVLIHDNESVEFRASGGFDYQWETERGKESYGILSTRTGPTTVYKSLYSDSNVVVQVLRVTATIQGDRKSVV